MVRRTGMKKMCMLTCICFFLGIGAVLPAWGFEGVDIPTLKKQAEQGDADSQTKLGVLYSTGIGVPMDKKEAVTWYKKAAGQGDPTAAWNLAFMYIKGEGVDKDFKKARNLFRYSAEQGFVNAQYDFGIVLLDGVGGEPDRDEAIKWLRKAASQGSRDAKKVLEQLGEQASSGK
jgi:TPR repeat protein